MRLAVLLCVPAWCHGEHALPRPSLVQVSSRGAAHAKAEAESLSRTLSGFQKFTDSLVEEYKDNAKSTAHQMVPVNNTMATTIFRIIEFIDGFFGSATLLHDIDVLKSAACSANTCFVDDCSFGATHTTQVIKDEMAQVQTALTAITTCLTNNAQQIYEHSVGCTAWDDFRRTAPPLPSCVYVSRRDSEDFCNNNLDKASSGDRGDFCDNRIKADENDDEEELEAMEECLEDLNLWMTPMWEAFQHCNPRDNTGEQSLPCQEKVTEYHRDHCEYTMVVSDDCKKYDTCVDDCKSDCDSTCENVEIGKNARKADNETGERIKCLLAALVDEVGANKTNILEEKEGDDDHRYRTAKEDALAACINDDAKVAYATKAEFFEITCASLVNEKVYPDGVNCEHQNQPVSCSIDYMDKLMNDGVDGVPLLKNYDAASNSEPALWNSCACGHKCQGSGGTDGVQSSESYTDLPKCNIVENSYNLGGWK